MVATETEPVFSLIGGTLSLDFTNTVSGWRELHGFDRENLDSYATLVSWGRQAGAIEGDEAAELIEEGRRRPQEAKRVLRRAVALREAIYRTFVAQVGARAPSSQDLETFNRELASALSHSRLEYREGRFEWGWAEDRAALDRVLWPVVRSAADLLTSGDIERVKMCEGETCGWLFVDMSRNRSRHWCDMRDCGNRAKAKRHYHRKKAAG